MQINWKIRFKNPTFWAHIAASFFLPIFTHAGVNWADMTTWPTLFHYVMSAFANPVVVVAIVVSLYNCINDPTTKGIADSPYALTKETVHDTPEVK